MDARVYYVRVARDYSHFVCSGHFTNLWRILKDKADINTIPRRCETATAGNFYYSYWITFTVFIGIATSSVLTLRLLSGL